MPFEDMIGKILASLFNTTEDISIIETDSLGNRIASSRLHLMHLYLEIWAHEHDSRMHICAFSINHTSRQEIEIKFLLGSNSRYDDTTRYITCHATFNFESKRISVQVINDMVDEVNGAIRYVIDGMVLCYNKIYDTAYVMLHR